jgi:hypothetical protein
MSKLISGGKGNVANTKLLTAILAGSLLVSIAPAANALTYSTSGSSTQFSLGDTLGIASPYDILEVLGTSGTITGTGPSTITLNTLVFTAGPNAITPANYVNQFSFTEYVTINTGTAGGTGSLTVPFNLSINTSDTLSIVGGTLSILVGSSVWNIVVNPLTLLPNSGGSEIALLTAQVSDPPATPLPAAVVLFGSGLGAIELLRRRRKADTRPASAV